MMLLWGVFLRCNLEDGKNEGEAEGSDIGRWRPLCRRRGKTIALFELDGCYDNNQHVRQEDVPIVWAATPWFLLVFLSLCIAVLFFQGMKPVDRGCSITR